MTTVEIAVLSASAVNFIGLAILWVSVNRIISILPDILGALKGHERDITTIAAAFLKESEVSQVTTNPQLH